MSQTLDIATLQQKSWYLILNHRTSPKQKDDAFRAMKTGSAHTLICTHSEIFHDFQDLWYILLIDQHSRLYKHQQDPRYHMVDVCKSIAEKYWACIDFTGISLSM
jgi:primosomal protein N'